MNRTKAGLITAFIFAATVGTHAQTGMVLSRGEATVAVEPYAANIVRVTLSLRKEEALGRPGYGITATANNNGWTREAGANGDVLRSTQMIVTVQPERKWTPTGTQADIAKFFNGSTPGVGIAFKTVEGKTILEMHGWEMSIPNHKDGDADVLYDRRPSDPDFFRIGATFDSPNDEHYYGLGQNQEGYLDRRGHVVRCAHDYDAPSGQSVCVPFVVTNYGYGLLWDNPSRTTVQFGFNNQTRWTSEVGRRVSFFVIAGKSYDEIYQGYRLLTGDTPMLPKSAYGYIQCKQRYTTQQEVLDVAREYRKRHLPADVMVVDWFYYTKMGEMDMDSAKWPDPVEMNRELHAMGFHSMISVWPRFLPESRFYDLINQNGWFMHLADGTPTDGLPYDRAGSDIDTTNPDAARWYWDTVRENFVTKGFDSFWADETEPDLPPNGSYFHVGPGTEYFNVYPLFHTASFYDGFRRDLKTRALILARDAYTGAQHNGAIFWSSDISPNWDTLKRQVSTGINFVASGMPYWSTDIGGWQYLPGVHVPERPPLLDASDARDNIGHYDDYPELYVRWFEYGAFQPNFRSHGSRKHNEVWSYGKQAEPILEKYLRLRYELMPYIYSLAHMTNETGAPFMRGLFMDFGDDPRVADIGDEYMFGPALLVAPVTEQGRTSRRIYLPAGTEWYDFWTNERFHGGQTITAAAPIDRIPIFVRAGAILPLGSAVESTNEQQKIAKVKVYPGADGTFTLYRDDGATYEYEKGVFEVTKLSWNNVVGKLNSVGARAWSDDSVIEIVGKK
jgi:alpha-D-xyloside xylohydrolase